MRRPSGVCAVVPAQAGTHVRKNWIPAFAGMTSPGVTLRRAERGISHCVENTQSEILRCAQDDSKGLGMTLKTRLSHSPFRGAEA